MSLQLHHVISRFENPTAVSRTRFAFVAIACLLLSMGCTRKNSENSQRTVTVALSAEPATIDPRFTTDATGSRLAHLLFTSIVRVGPDLDIIGEAASSWSYDAKALTYSFQLKPGIRFHSEEANSPGRALTADDIRYTFQVYRDASSPFASALKPIDIVETDYNVEKGGALKLKLNSFSATLLTDLSPVKLLPKDVVERAKSEFARRPIGTGPFQFVSSDSNEIRLKANSAHFESPPRIEHVVFKVVREDNTRVLKLQKGEIDIAQQELPQGKVAQFEGSPDFQVFKYPGLGMNYILLNLKDDLLKDPEFRSALSFAVDRESIIRHTLSGLAQPASTLLSPVTVFFDSSVPVPTFDLSRSKEILKKLGRVGTALTLKTTNSPQAVENGRIIANQLEQAGLKVNLQSFEWGTFYEDLKKGNYQLATARWVGVTDPDLYRLAFHSKEVPPNGRNRGFYSNSKIDEWTEQGLKISNPADRIQHYRKVQKLISDEKPIIPLWYDFEVAVVRKSISDYRPSKNGDYTALTKVQKGAEPSSGN